jgi:hypothetical protein
MDVGYNYPGPSNKFGNWLGPFDRQDRWPSNYAQLWKDLPFKSAIQSNLGILKQHGIKVVRWFLLGNGFNYGLPPKRRKEAYWVVRARDYGSWEFDPPDRLDPLFLDHFRQLLEIHKEVGMQLIPSLVSFEFFATHETQKTAAGGRGDIAIDWQKRNKFLFTVLGEFLRVSNDYRSLIYAWEVINEPAWDVRNITPTLTGTQYHIPFVPQESMTTFIRLALDWIKDKGFESTVGHRFYSDLSLMPTGTRPQFHYYAQRWACLADPRKLPTAAEAKGAFVGEFGSLIGEGYETNQTPHKASYGQPWDTDFSDGRDKDPRNTVYERLLHMKKLGYQLALVWPEYADKSVDAHDGLKISPEKLASIKRFVDSQ